MPRRREVPKRPILPDPKFGDPIVSHFVNKIMSRGKKSIAERIVYGAFEIIEDRTREDPVKVFKRALENVMPMVEVKSRRVGGSTYQVPIEVRPARRGALAMRWILTYARSRPDHTMAERLAGELLAAYRKEGASMKKRDETHRMAEANKAFAHFKF